MEISQTPGTPSSSLLSTEEAAQKLSVLGNSPLLAPLLMALGPKADLHLVGGTVRDIFRGLEPSDIDLATALAPEQAMESLTKKGLRVIATGLRHGTLTVVVDHQNIEITSFRKPQRAEEDYRPASIIEDLSGRDFTINALAWSLEKKKLLDPHAGLSDLRHSILRAVGDADIRIKEDALRIMRAVRLGAAQNFAVEPALAECCGRNSSLLQGISTERIRSEFEKILISPGPRAAFYFMLRYGILKEVLPELLPAVGFEQNRFHSEDVFEHTLTVIEATPPDLELRLTALFHDIGKPGTLSIDEEGERHFYEHEVLSTQICKRVMQRLRFSNLEIHAVTSLVRSHMRPLECGPAGLRRIMRDLGPEFPKWREFKKADIPQAASKEQLDAQQRRFDQMLVEELERREKAEQKRIAVNGNDLMALGYVEGRELGQVLKELEELVIENPDLNNRADLLQAAAERLNK